MEGDDEDSGCGAEVEEGVVGWLFGMLDGLVLISRRVRLGSNMLGCRNRVKTQEAPAPSTRRGACFRRPTRRRPSQLHARLRRRPGREAEGVIGWLQLVTDWFGQQTHRKIVRLLGVFRVLTAQLSRPWSGSSAPVVSRPVWFSPSHGQVPNYTGRCRRGDL